MTSPDILGSELVGLLMALADIASALTGGVSLYQETESGLARAVYQLPIDSGILAYIGSELVEDGGEVVQHTFNFYARLSAGTFGGLVNALHSGIPSGQQQTFVNLDLSNGERIVVESASRANDEELNEYFEIRITVNDRNFV